MASSRSTTEPIFILRQMIEKYRAAKKDLHAIFNDLEKAYDSVPRQSDEEMTDASSIVDKLKGLKVKEGLFKTVKYYVIGKIHDQVNKVLSDGGAKDSKYLTQLISLAIADDPNQGEVEEATDVYDIPVVTSGWVLLSAKCGECLPLKGFRPNRDQLFSNVTACPSQLSKEDTKSIWALLNFHGGKFQVNLNKACTHLITTKSQGMKYTISMKNVGRIKIVTPDWVYESIKARKKLDEDRYHPKLLVMPSIPVSVVSVDPLSTLSSSDDSPFSEDVAEQLSALVNDESDEVDGRELEPSLTLTPTALLKLNLAEPKVPLLVQTADSSAVSARSELLTKPLLSPHRSNPLPDATPPLQMKSSLWMTQQVQGAFGQPQLAPPPSPVNTARENVTWAMPGDRQIRESSPSGQQITQQQHSLVWQQHLPPTSVHQHTLSQSQQPLLHQQTQLQVSQGQQQQAQLQQSPQQQGQLQQSPQQQGQLQQSPQQQGQLQQSPQQQGQLQQSPQHIQQQHQHLQQHIQQQLQQAPSHIQQQQLIQHLQHPQQQPGLPQSRPQLTPQHQMPWQNQLQTQQLVQQQQRMQVITLQQHQRQQLQQHHQQHLQQQLQQQQIQAPQTSPQRPIPPAWQKQGIPPRDASPQFIGQPQTQPAPLPRQVIIQRGITGQPPAGWFQRSQVPQQPQFNKVAWQQQQREQIPHLVQQRIQGQLQVSPVGQQGGESVQMVLKQSAPSHQVTLQQSPSQQIPTPQQQSLAQKPHQVLQQPLTPQQQHQVPISQQQHSQSFVQQQLHPQTLPQQHLQAVPRQTSQLLQQQQTISHHQQPFSQQQHQQTISPQAQQQHQQTFSQNHHQTLSQQSHQQLQQALSQQQHQQVLSQQHQQVLSQQQQHQQALSQQHQVLSQQQQHQVLSQQQHQQTLSQQQQHQQTLSQQQQHQQTLSQQQQHQQTLSQQQQHQQTVSQQQQHQQTVSQQQQHQQTLSQQQQHQQTLSQQQQHQQVLTQQQHQQILSQQQHQQALSQQQQQHQQTLSQQQHQQVLSQQQLQALSQQHQQALSQQQQQALSQQQQQALSQQQQQALAKQQHQQPLPQHQVLSHQLHQQVLPQQQQAPAQQQPLQQTVGPQKQIQQAAVLQQHQHSVAPQHQQTVVSQQVGTSPPQSLQQTVAPQQPPQQQAVSPQQQHQHAVASQQQQHQQAVAPQQHQQVVGPPQQQHQQAVAPQQHQQVVGPPQQQHQQAVASQQHQQTVAPQQQTQQHQQTVVPHPQAVAPQQQPHQQAVAPQQQAVVPQQQPPPHQQAVAPQQSHQQTVAPQQQHQQALSQQLHQSTLPQQVQHQQNLPSQLQHQQTLSQQHHQVASQQQQTVSQQQTIPQQQHQQVLSQQPQPHLQQHRDVLPSGIPHQQLLIQRDGSQTPVSNLSVQSPMREGHSHLVTITQKQQLHLHQQSQQSRDSSQLILPQQPLHLQAREGGAVIPQGSPQQQHLPQNWQSAVQQIKHVQWQQQHPPVLQQQHQQGQLPLQQQQSQPQVQIQQQQSQPQVQLQQQQSQPQVPLQTQQQQQILQHQLQQQLQQKHLFQQPMPQGQPPLSQGMTHQQHVLTPQQHQLFQQRELLLKRQQQQLLQHQQQDGSQHFRVRWPVNQSPVQQVQGTAVVPQQTQTRPGVPQRVTVSAMGIQGNVVRYHTVAQQPVQVQQQSVTQVVSQPQASPGPHPTLQVQQPQHLPPPPPPPTPTPTPTPTPGPSPGSVATSPGHAGQSSTTQLPRDSLHQVVQQGQEQIQQQLQNLANQSQPQLQQVTPKTKTALANLLNNRLQGSPRLSEVGEVVASSQPPPPPPSPVARMPVPLRDPEYQRTLRNITNSGKPATGIRPQGGKQGSGLRYVMPPPTREAAVGQLVTPPRVHFFGHDPSIKVPPDLSFLGSVFCFIDYDRIVEPERLQIWKKIICQRGGEVEITYSPRCTHILCDSLRNSVVQQAMREGKRCVTAYWLSDVLAQKKMTPPFLALHFPTPFSEDKPCKNQIITLTNFDGEERERLKSMVLLAGAKYTGYMTRANTVLICRKLEGEKFNKAKDWKIPCVNVQWLHDVLFGHYEALQLPTAQKYQQFNLDDPFKVDYALVPHLMASWRVFIKVPEECWKKFAPNPAVLTSIQEKKRKSDTENDKEKKKKRSSSPENVENDVQVTSPCPPPTGKRPSVLFTGIKGTTDLAKKILQLGGVIAKSPKDCTHLVSESVCRTVKFLMALNYCKYIVTKNWILDSAKQNRFADEKTYILNDPSNETQFGCSIKQIVSRPNRSPVFQGLTFYLTPGVKPSYSIIKELIECAGGTVTTKRPPSKEIAVTNQTSPHFIIICSENDVHLCAGMIKHNIAFYNSEFVLTGVMRQEVDFQSFVFKVPTQTG